MVKETSNSVDMNGPGSISISVSKSINFYKIKNMKLFMHILFVIIFLKVFYDSMELYSFALAFFSLTVVKFSRTRFTYKDFLTLADVFDLLAPYVVMFFYVYFYFKVYNLSYVHNNMVVYENNKYMNNEKLPVKNKYKYKK